MSVPENFESLLLSSLYFSGSGGSSTTAYMITTEGLLVARRFYGNALTPEFFTLSPVHTEGATFSTTTFRQLAKRISKL